MKSIIALAIVLVAATTVTALSDERKELLKVWGKECVAESGVDTQKITALRQGNFSDDDKLKNFMLCVYKKAGSVNDDGTFNRDQVLADIGDNPTVRDAAIGCLDKRGSTPAEGAWLSYKCFRSSVPADYKTPW